MAKNDFFPQYNCTNLWPVMLECTLHSLVYTWRKDKLIFNYESLRLLKESNISRMPCVATTDQPNGFDISAVFHLCPALPTAAFGSMYSWFLRTRVTSR